MSRLRVNAFGISIDGYGAGPDQDLDNPMGVGGMALHKWVFGTKTFQKMAADFAGSLIGDEVGREGVDDDFAARGFENVGAWILGRNMFGPLRGPWSDDSWKGWWGNNPPYHVPLRADAPCSRPHHDGGRNDVPLRYRWKPCCVETRDRGGSRQGRPTWRWRRHHSPVPHRWADRRDPPRDLSRAPRPRRASPRRHRHGEPRLQVHGARLHGPRHACCPDEVTPKGSGDASTVSRACPRDRSSWRRFNRRAEKHSSLRMLPLERLEERD